LCDYELSVLRVVSEQRPVAFLRGVRVPSICHSCGDSVKNEFGPLSGGPDERLGKCAVGLEFLDEVASCPLDERCCEVALLLRYCVCSRENDVPLGSPLGG